MALDENTPLADLERGIGVEPVDSPAEDEPVDSPAEDEPVDSPAEDEPVDSPAEDVEEEHLTRGEKRIQKLANERAEAQAEARIAKEQAEFYRQQMERLSQQANPSVDEYIDPDEKWRREAQAGINEAQTKANQTLFMAQDMKDEAAFMRLCAKDPLAEKYADKVEAQLKTSRAQGMNPTREAIFDFISGQDARVMRLANQGKQSTAAKKASERVAAAKTTTPRVQSNVTPPRASSTAEERLLGVEL